MLVSTIDDKIQAFLIAGLSMVAGAYVTYIGVRVRLAKMQDQIDVNTKMVADCQGRIDWRLKKMDARQMFVIKMLVDVSNKLDLDNRFSDLAVKLMADDHDDDNVKP